MTTLVRDVMKREVRCTSSDTSLLDLERTLVDDHFEGLPVVDGGKLVGVVSRFDIVRRLLSSHEFHEYAEAEQRTTGVSRPPREPRSAAARRLSFQELGSVQVKHIMSEHPVTISPDTPLDLAGKVLLEKNIHRLVVVDEGRVIVILSALDIVRFYCDPR